MFEVGQTLYFVRSTHPNRTMCSSVTVEKVGRKWATLSNRERVNAEGYADGRGYSSPGRAWPSQEAYEAEKRREKAWSDLQYRMRNQYSVPKHLSEASILEARRILFGEPSDA